MDITGRKMDAAWKQAISNGKKLGAKAGAVATVAGRKTVSLGAKGFLAATPNEKARVRGLNIIGGAAGIGTLSMLAGVPHSLGFMTGAALGGVTNKKLEMIAEAKKKLGVLPMSYKTRAAVRGLPIGAKAGLKYGVRGAKLLTGVMGVGGTVVGGTAGALTHDTSLGKKMNKSLKKAAKK